MCRPYRPNNGRWYVRGYSYLHDCQLTCTSGRGNQTHRLVARTAIKTVRSWSPADTPDSCHIFVARPRPEQISTETDPIVAESHVGCIAADTPACQTNAVSTANVVTCQAGVVQTLPRAE